MKKPQTPPPTYDILASWSNNPRVFSKMLEFARNPAVVRKDYLHWDQLRHRPVPAGLTHKEWWVGLKLMRQSLLKPIPLADKQQNPFRFCIPDFLLESLHKIDMKAGENIGMTEETINQQAKDRYLVRSLMEEAISSSQLEGAATTRDIAKEMIRSGRPPRDKSERMILNNYKTMLFISNMEKSDLTPDLIFKIHLKVTDQTLENPAAAGRYRTPSEKIDVGDEIEDVEYHVPPPAEELPERIRKMCDFANCKTPDYFIHPVVRAIILHFWLAYDHPFVDGNGRTARAIFYWAMRRYGYWLFEFISISSILKEAAVPYYMSFLYSETDDNDLTYFIAAQIEVIGRAIRQLHEYLDRKTNEIKQAELYLSRLGEFNSRQIELLRYALKHPLQQYTIKEHQRIYNIVYQTARTDLLGLVKYGLFKQDMKGRKIVFTASLSLLESLRRMNVKIQPDKAPQKDNGLQLDFEFPDFRTYFGPGDTNTGAGNK